MPYTVDQSSEGDVLQSSEWDITFLAHGAVAVTVTYTYDGTSSTTDHGARHPAPHALVEREPRRAPAERREWDSNPR